MNLYLVKHGCSKPYLFQGSNEYKPGDEVICQTRKGEDRGIIVVAFTLSNEEKAKVITAACGAYWPLAKILRKYQKPVITSIDEIPQVFIDKIRSMERNYILSQIRQEMPFDL